MRWSVEFGLASHIAVMETLAGASGRAFDQVAHPKTASDSPDVLDYLIVKVSPGQTSKIGAQKKAETGIMKICFRRKNVDS